MITLRPDDEWVASMGFFRRLAGGTLAVVLVLAVIALVVAVVVLMLTKAAPQVFGSRHPDPSSIFKVMLAAALAGSLSGLVGWGGGLDLGQALRSFYSGGKSTGVKLETCQGHLADKLESCKE
ncbi:hypothetical protein HF995_13425 [Sanguibacter hominis ATCC BAA-789]|uniref:Uncharacterized protein n=1 Tax=Sanguibacter hominis ATCC BAA-789 TaxID=1312740 RepID=A0A9X5FF98_9MICO|nr:hypothetical protein [Sanguibacter hominis]NKX94257.1 hypothetical protein [Sanguibacter hominis ATCC BAA-789]